MIQEKIMGSILQRTPECYYGKGSLLALKAVKGRDILLLMSKSVHDSEQMEKITKYLEGKEYTLEIVPDNGVKTVEALAMKSRPDVIIAIGGGKVLDCAKMVRARLTHTLDEVQNGFDTRAQGDAELIAIPSTPGTGSEVSPIAVLLDGDKKRIFVNKALVPDIAILDSNLLLSLPKGTLQDCCCDIFAHAYEASVSRLATPSITEIAKVSLTLLEQAWMILKEKPDDAKALSMLFQSGHLAGIAQGNAFVGVCHAIAHSLEEMVGLSHGRALAHVLKASLSYHAQKSENGPYLGYLQSLQRMGLCDHIERLENVDTEMLCERALADASIKTNPLRMDRDGVKELWMLR